MDRLARLIALFSLFVVCDARAAGTAYQWTMNASTQGWSSSLSAAGAAQLSSCNVSQTTIGSCISLATCGTTYTCTISISSCQFVGTFPAGSCSWASSATNNSTHAVTNQTGTWTASTRSDPSGSPDCAMAGTRSTMLSASPVSAGAISCTDSCMYKAISPSTWIVSSGASYVVSVSSMGRSCASTPDANGAPNTTAGVCVQSSGVTSCASASENCGEFNGDLVCVPSIPANSCVSFSSGAVACVAGASGAPNNGTAGVPATPSAQMTQGGTTVNYYNSSVVNNSTTTTTTVGTGSNTGGISSGSGGGSSSAGSGSSSAGSGSSSSGSSGGVTGGQSCSVPPSCTGDAIQCAILMQSYKNHCEDAISGSDVTAAVGSPDSPHTESVDLSSSLDESLFGVSAGSCPANPTFTVMGHDFTLPIANFLCQFFSMIAPMVMALGYLVAGRVLVEAV